MKKHYTFELDYEITNCNICPFRHERVLHEDIESRNTMTGTVTIMRRESVCILLQELLVAPHHVGGYKTKCPLQVEKVEGLR